LLIVAELDRLSPKLASLAWIISELAQSGVRVVSADGSLDTGSPIGGVQIQLLGALAELERREIRDRIGRAVERRARSGRRIGPLPIGFRGDSSGKPVSDPAWLPVVERVYQLYVEERLTRGSIAARLNAEGTRTPRGARWTGASVLRILRCGAYVGRIRWKGRFLPAAHDPVIDRQLWDQAQRLLAAERRRGSRP
jgi:DNA invertase Pin-like site-specific DNA recombinase